MTIEEIKEELGWRVRIAARAILYQCGPSDEMGKLCAGLFASHSGPRTALDESPTSD